MQEQLILEEAIYNRLKFIETRDYKYLIKYEECIEILELLNPEVNWKIRSIV